MGQCDFYYVNEGYAFSLCDHPLLRNILLGLAANWPPCGAVESTWAATARLAIEFSAQHRDLMTVGRAAQTVLLRLPRETIGRSSVGMSSPTSACRGD